MLKPIIAIPARMGSSRLPGKPLANLGGRPMILHVLEKARRADLGPTLVATDSQEIRQVVEQAGGIAQLTPSDCPSGSDRIFAALERFDPEQAYDVVINLQGDEPFIEPDAIRQAYALLKDNAVDIGTLAVSTEDAEIRADPNSVKIAAAYIDARRVRALYFSRAAIPWGDGPFLRHVGLYAYRRRALARFVSLPPSALELREKLEQLRALEAHMRIDAALIPDARRGVDTPEDLERAQSAFVQSAFPHGVPTFPHGVPPLSPESSAVHIRHPYPALLPARDG